MASGSETDPQSCDAFLVIITLISVRKQELDWRSWNLSPSGTAFCQTKDQSILRLSAKLVEVEIIKLH